MPLQETSGTASYDAFGGGVAAVPNYIEDVFSTYLYTGNGSTQTITNGIDLSGKGGLVWTKQRNGGAVAQDNGHALIDTVRGRGSLIQSNTTAAALAPPAGYQISSFGSSGYSLGSDYYVLMNDNGSTFASWTFRKQPKFFDVVTYTGDGTAGRTVAHSLGSVPGTIIIKCTSNARNWRVWHRSFTTSQSIVLNSTAAVDSLTNILNSTAPTDSVFTLSSDPDVNNSGYTYVAYLFAHNAGGFGLTGTDNVISCGSFTTNGSGNATVNLGYEPQYVLLKCSSAVEGWIIEDTMRGASYSSTAGLFANTSGAEFSNTPIAIPTATGFVSQNGQLQVSQTYIYIAIRRGPMKVPTSGTSVFAPQTLTVDDPRTWTSNFPIDSVWERYRSSSTNNRIWDRLRGNDPFLDTSATTAETSSAGFGWNFANNTGGVENYYGSATNPLLSYMFRRAPSFFDEVCYTGTGVARTVTHNLGVAPELMIVKQRTGSIRDWCVYSQGIGATKALYLNLTDASSTTSIWNNTTPTASVFSLAGLDAVNASGGTFVAYLFATCAGVSKVGSYTGTGATLQIDCGFTGGARFVLIKRTDSTGDWYVWDTARGMVSGTDPSLLLNSTAAEVNANSIYTTTGGFQIVSTAAGINASGGTYIYLAIA